MLEGWQAYHALTYEDKWKKDVDKVWSNYKSAWKSEHPDKKPPKNRFQILIEFIKEKYAEETTKMKERCEEYRKKDHEEKLEASKIESTTNTKYQS